MKNLIIWENIFASILVEIAYKTVGTVKDVPIVKMINIVIHKIILAEC